ncbi:hypothetical protein ACOME3_004457 [Neoechinorhynchus agilis]
MSWPVFSIFDVDKDFLAIPGSSSVIYTSLVDESRMLYCLQNGKILIIDCKNQLDSFNAFELQLVCAIYDKSSQALVTIGQDKKEYIIFKIFNLKRERCPLCIRSEELNEHPTAVSVDSLSNRMALGMDGGSIFITKGSIYRGIKSRKELSETKYPIRHLFFAKSTDNPYIHLFVISDSSVFLIKNALTRSLTHVLIEDRSCDACSLSEKQELILASGNLITIYEEDTRKNSLVVDRTVKCVSKSGDYQLLVGFVDNIFRIYELKGKFIALECSLNACIIQPVSESKFKILDKNSTIYTINQKPIETPSASLNLLNRVYYNYGNYLFARGDYADAVDQYCLSGALNAIAFDAIEKFINVDQASHLISLLERNIDYLDISRRSLCQLLSLMSGKLAVHNTQPLSDRLEELSKTSSEVDNFIDLVISNKDDEKVIRTSMQNLERLVHGRRFSELILLINTGLSEEFGDEVEKVMKTMVVSESRIFEQILKNFPGLKLKLPTLMQFDLETFADTLKQGLQLMPN